MKHGSIYNMNLQAPAICSVVCWAGTGGEQHTEVVDGLRQC